MFDKSESSSIFILIFFLVVLWIIEGYWSFQFDIWLGWYCKQDIMVHNIFKVYSLFSKMLLCFLHLSFLCMLSCFGCVWLFVTPRTVACQAPLSMGFSRQWVPMPSSRGSSWPRDGTCVSYIFSIGRQHLTTCATWEAPNIQSISMHS